jgi:tetratricopeptide (TPR) repeat protein
MGAVALASGQYASAVSRLSEAVAADPNLEEAHLDLSAALALAGELDAAVKVLTRAESLFPKNAGFPYNRGLVLARMNLPGEARAALERASRIDPAHAGAHWALSVLAVEAGDLPRARAHWRKVVQSPQAAQDLRQRAMQCLRVGGPELVD